jgi:hypothetical protein
MSSRYQVVQLLHDHAISSCLWSEDVLAFYGVPTVLFELYLLIADSDFDKAVSILSESPGYRHVPPDEEEMATNRPRRYFLQYWVSRYTNPGGDDDKIGLQLLPAKQFAQFEISPDTTVQQGILLYPKLAKFIEALVYQYLRPAKTRAACAYATHVRMYIVYLAAYAPERDSVLQLLSPKACQLWGDLLKGKMILGEEGIEHYRKIDGILECPTVPSNPATTKTYSPIL